MLEDSRELLIRYQQGEATAANAIFDRYAGRLLALARSRLSSKLSRRVDADDVVQSTYRSFFVHARQGEFAIEHEGDLWRLLATMTLHKLGRQAQRHRAKKRSVDREVPGRPDEPDALAQLADREPSAADVVAAAEELHWLMSQFDVTQRQALQLRLQDLTIDEIAAQVGRSERTVRRWLVEARELLSRRWAEQQRGDRPDAHLVPSSPISQTVTKSVATLRHADYHFERLIGSGGVSKVYAATYRASGIRVAIKVLRKRLRSRPHLVERFLREAELVRRFRHPNIVPVHGLGRLPDGNYFMVLDLIDGPDLAKLCRFEPLPPRRAARIVADVAGAIQHAHDHGVIHRDLKPGNVLVDGQGRVFVTDFGFAWFDGDLDRNDLSIVGTAGFMAPEQIDPTLGPVGPQTDIYGLGALLSMLCRGRASLSANPSSGTQVQFAEAAEEVSLTEAHPAMPWGLRSICERCLLADWRARFATATDVAVALQLWEEDIGIDGSLKS